MCDGEFGNMTWDLKDDWEFGNTTTNLRPRIWKHDV